MRNKGQSSPRPTGGGKGIAPRALGRQLVLLGTTLGILLAVGVGVVLFEFRHAAIHRDISELQRMALVLADQAERAFQSLEAVQNGLQQEMHNRDIDTTEEFRGQSEQPDLHEQLRQRIAGLSHVELIALIDDKGHLVGHSHTVPLPEADFSGRDFFVVLREAPPGAHYVSPPLTDPDGKVWTVHLAQRVSGAKGEFLGVVVGAVRLRYFENLYGTVAATSGDVISLVYADGDVLARFPALAGRPADGAGNPLAASIPVSSLRHRIEHAVAAPKDFSAVYKMGNYPVEVRVSRSAADVLGGWRTEAAVILAGAGLAELGLAGVVLLGVRQIRNNGRLAEAERQAREQDMRFATAMEHLNQGVCMLDRRGHVAVINPRLRELLNVPAHVKLIGGSLADIARAAIAGGHVTSADIRALRTAIDALPHTAPASFSLTLSDGRVFEIELDETPDGGRLATVEDSTERHRAEARIHHLAHHDPLTGLANRTLFSQRLRETIAQAAEGVPAALLCIDLDHFKQVNDQHGHPTGDALLCAAAERLRGCLRASDLAARLGGDEFAVLQIGAAQPSGAEVLGPRLVSQLGAPYEIDGRRLSVRASVGSTMVRADDDEVTLMRRADVALYRAKDEGRDRHVLDAGS